MRKEIWVSLEKDVVSYTTEPVCKYDADIAYSGHVKQNPKMS